MNNHEDVLGGKLLDEYTVELIKQRVDFWLANPPSMMCVNVVLTDMTALKYVIIKEIIMHCGGLSEQDADWYLLYSGIIKELDKLSIQSMIKIEDEHTN